MPVRNSILLLDDQPEHVAHLKCSLEKADWDVSVLSSPLMALELIASKPFQIILTDYQMPEMSGIEFIRRAKEKSPTCRFILMSAAFDDEAQRFCRRLAIRLLQKPFSSEKFLQEIRDLRLAPSKTSL